MADVFVSYARGDRALIEVMAANIEVAGFSTWWDTSVTSGEAFRAIIAREIDLAKCVVVVWSTSSIASEWVISEAQRAAQLNKLITVRMPDVDIRTIPQPFELRQTDLVTDFTSLHKAISKYALGSGACRLRTLPTLVSS
jgi:TIR domain-containing protein